MLHVGKVTWKVWTGGLSGPGGPLSRQPEALHTAEGWLVVERVWVGMGIGMDGDAGIGNGWGLGMGLGMRV